MDFSQAEKILLQDYLLEKKIPAEDKNITPIVWNVSSGTRNWISYP